MNSGKIQAPVFVLCCARSGSTLLRYILDTHPQLCCPPELHLCSLLRQLMWVYGHTSTLKKQGAQDQAIFSAAATQAGATVSAIMDEYVERNGKQTWCEKSVYTIDFIDIVGAAFPAARYICLYRDCKDFVRSSLDTLASDPTGAGYGFAPYYARHPNDRNHALMEYWVEKTERILQFEQGYPAACIRLRYEDIVQQPDATLAALFNELGLEWNRQLTDAIFSTYHDAGPGDNKIRSTNRINTDSLGRGAGLSTSQIPAPVLARLQALSQQLGYQIQS